MEKIKIDLDIVLPDIPDEKDSCVQRIISSMENHKGIDKVHIVPETETTKAKLCLHYNPDEISIERVQKLAEKSGAEITERFGHLLLEVKGIRYVRHARIIELSLRDVKGILSVSASAAGWINIEFDHHEINPQKIYSKLHKLGLTVVSPDLKTIPVHIHVHIAKENLLEEDSKEEPEHEHKHEEHDHAVHDHEHSHGGIFGEKTELIYAIICGVLLGIGFGLSFAKGSSDYVSIGFYIAAYFFGGFYTSKEAIEGISKGDFEIDFLMLVAAIGAACLGQWAEGALLLFLFSLGHSLEHYAMEKAKKSIAALTELAPKTALLKNGKELKEVKIEELKAGDVIVVKPNSAISADGIVVNGNSSVNQAPITGESVPVDKVPVEDVNMDVTNADKLDAKYRVFAGSINGGEVLDIKVSKVAANSTIARLVKMVNEAQTQKSPTQNFTDKLEKYYVPSVLILVGLLLFAFLVRDEPFSQSFYRAMAVLVAASPCALAIATPSAVLSGVARAARAGVLIKGGRPLEELGSLTAIAFDKTGTLTEGKPKLTGVYPLNGMAEEQLLSIVISVEKLSDHPLAAAIVKGGTEKLKKDVLAASNVQAINGRGIKADYEGTTIHIGNKELFTEKNNQLPEEIKTKVEELESQGNTTMLVEQNDKLIGIITLMDVARQDAKETLARLSKIGIRKMIMLTGDNQKVAEAIAKEIGITDAWGNLLPEHKVEAKEKLRAS
ncbi:MAG TPA: heavy metal translocating P-type ATPase, partial [Chitinophagaceae bacterium]|nr:heavy metal translocating P-type ATPase [Chitinophagaceae bacterium]